MIIFAIENRLSLKRALEIAGISKSQYQTWLSKGKKGIKRYKAFRDRVLKAHIQNEKQALDVITKAAKGKIKTEILTVYINESHTKVVKRIIQNKPDWKASAWYLERRYKPDYLRQFKDYIELQESFETTAKHINNTLQEMINSVEVKEEN